jgi:hypothetical protein
MKIKKETVGKLKKACGGFNLITCNSLLVATHARLGAEIGAIGSRKELKGALDELGVYYRESKGFTGFTPITISISKEHYELYERGSNLRKTDPLEAHRVLGEFFGYPKCCTDRYIKDLKEDRSPLERYLTQLVEKISGMTGSRVVKIMGKLGALPGISDLLTKLAPKFMQGFAAPLMCYHIPCSPDCRESIKTGETILKNLGEIDPELRDWFFQTKVSGLVFLIAAHSDFVLKGKYFM